VLGAIARLIWRRRRDLAGRPGVVAEGMGLSAGAARHLAHREYDVSRVWAKRGSAPARPANRCPCISIPPASLMASSYPKMRNSESDDIRRLIELGLEAAKRSGAKPKGRKRR
jgi:hypothetical protein